VRIGILHSRIRLEEKLLLEELDRRRIDYELIDDRQAVFDLPDGDWRRYDVILERCISHSRALAALKVLRKELRLETDAVVSAFTDSDFGRDGGTNTEGHILQTGYTLTKNLSFVSTAWITEPVNNVSGRSSDTDYRWQVDLLAKF